MAGSFSFNEIYEDENWVAVYKNAEGYQDKFLNQVQKELELSEFPNIDISIDDYVSGGIFSSETTKMLRMKAKKSMFKKFEIFFRAQVFGNVVVYSRFECMNAGFFGSLLGKTGEQIYAEVRAKCKNLAQYEEFIAIDQLADLVYERALMSLDPDYKDKKLLMKMGND